MIVRKLSVGYADLDEGERFEDMSSWTFLLAENVNEKFESYVIETSKSDSPLAGYAEEGVASQLLIGSYLYSISAMGRSVELYVGTIRCALEGDTDGLSRIIDSDGIAVDIYDVIPEVIEESHDGRMFCLAQAFNFGQHFSETSLKQRAALCNSLLEERLCVSA